MTTNLEITRAALEDKKAALQTRVDELNTTRQQTINDRAHNLLAPALSVYSPTEIIITNGYSESIFINVIDSKDRRTEILSIHTRSYGTNYLNTYSTTISDEFELKRLVFNGKVAELFLNDSEFYNKLFAPTEIDEECTRLNDELHSVDGTLRETKRAITQAFVDDQINKLKAGQEIEFNDLKTITYGRGKWECAFRVVKMKAEWVTNKKANVTFTCKQWGDNEHEIIIRPGVLDKYLISALHYSQ